MRATVDRACLPPGRHGQGPDPCSDRRDSGRVRRRRPLRSNSTGEAVRRAQHGRSHDDLQHGRSRAGAAGRRSSRRMKRPMRISRNRPKSPKGALWDDALRYWEDAALRRGAPHMTAENPPRCCAARCRRSSPGAPTRSRSPSIGGCVAVAGGDRRWHASARTAKAARWAIWDLNGGREDYGHRHRSRLHRQVASMRASRICAMPPRRGWMAGR